jgi:spore coat polysaccharide biosynthesis predicted glycosyltransferase SpsG
MLYILTNASTKIGLGHFYRSLAICQTAIKSGIDVRLFVNYDIHIDLSLYGSLVKPCNWNSFEWIENDIDTNGYYIIDSYNCDFEWKKALYERNRNIVFIDDRPNVEIPTGVQIVFPMLYEIKSNGKYIFSGSKYIILRDEIVDYVEKQNIRQRKKYEIMVLIGGTDILGLTDKIIETLYSKLGQYTFHVVGKNKYSHLERVKTYTDLSGTQIARLMVNCTFGILAAGQTIHEAIFLSLPFIPIQVIENQHHNVLGLKYHRIVEEVMDGNSEQFTDELVLFTDRLISSYDENKNKHFSHLIDGKGASRILKLLNMEN